MKHRSSKILFDHWMDKRGARLAPERSEIDPAVLRSALGDTFILTFNPLMGHPFRLAGTRVCALFGRELKASGFAPLWRSTGKTGLAELAAAAADDSVGLIAGATGASEAGLELDLELLLLPLRHCGQSHLRMIGALSPLSTPYWFGMEKITHLLLGEYRFVGHAAAAPPLVQLPPAALQPTRQRHGLKVYDGGQA